MKKAKDKWIEIIAKITELTQDNILKWRIREVPNALKGFADVRIDAVYSSIYKGNHLRIYEKKKKETIMVNFHYEITWETSTVLDLVEGAMADPHGISQWAFPQVEGLNNLLNAVKFQVIEVKDFLKKLTEE